MTLDEALETVRNSIRAAAEAIRDLPDEKLVELATIAARATGAPQRYALGEIDPADPTPARVRTLEFSAKADPGIREQLAPMEAKLSGSTNGVATSDRPTAALRAETKEVAEGDPRPTELSALERVVVDQLKRRPLSACDLIEAVAGSMGKSMLYRSLTELHRRGLVVKPAKQRMPWSLA